MSVEAKIVGFDRSSDLAGIELNVPPQVLPRVMQIADVPDTDPDLLGCYPLDAVQVARIAEIAQIIIDPDRFIYFLEAYEE